MAIYELRTYDVIVGKMSEVIDLYKNYGYPALQKGGFDKNLVGYFVGDVGAINQLVHIWKFDDPNARDAFWKRLFADDDFMAFAGKLRPNVKNQQNKLMNAAPWGSHP
ncbi:MAG: NIPSNAP family protein [Burkholderiaceae bacterium]